MPQGAALTGSVEEEVSSAASQCFTDHNPCVRQGERAVINAHHRAWVFLVQPADTVPQQQTALDNCLHFCPDAESRLAACPSSSVMCSFSDRFCSCLSIKAIICITSMCIRVMPFS